MPYRYLPLGCVFALILGWTAVCPAPAAACSCAEQTQQQAFETATAVFEGRVLEIQPAEQTKKTKKGKQAPETGETDQTAASNKTAARTLQVRMLVVRAWKGVKQEQLVVHTAKSGAACGYHFKEGESYLVYADIDAGSGVTGVSLCSRTRPMAEASDDIEALGLGAVPVNPEPSKEERQALAASAAPEPRPSGCASCEVVHAAGLGDGIAASTLLFWTVVIGLWRARRHRRP